MKSNDFLSEDIASDAHDMHLDHEVQMARKDCYAAADDAIALHKLLRNVSEQQGLEGWVAAKITLASDYLNTVREHLEYQLMSQVQPEAMELPVAEGAMPASVIKVKEKIRLMPAAEKKDYFKGKSKEQLQKMARSHGYGENSNVYAQYATESVAEDRGQNQQWSNKDMESLRRAETEIEDMFAAPNEVGTKLKQSQIKNRIKTRPMAGPKGVLPEQGVAEGASSHAELAQMAYDAYVAATRKGNGPMAAHYLKQHLKHKADAAKAKSGVAEAADPESQKFGKYIKKYFGQIYDYGDDGLEYLDNNAPFWAMLFDKHDGDIDYIIAMEPADVLKKAALELKAVAGDLEYELDEQGVAEGEINTARMNKPHQDFYSKNPHFKRDDKEVVAQGGKLATKVSPSGTKQVSKKPATPFGKTVSEDASGGASGAGSVASVNNPGGKPKSQVGSLFGGTFQREGEDAKPAKKAKAKLSK